jgi:hypothetical protein
MTSASRVVPQEGTSPAARFGHMVGYDARVRARFDVLFVSLEGIFSYSRHTRITPLDSIYPLAHLNTNHTTPHNKPKTVLLVPVVRGVFGRHVPVALPQRRPHQRHGEEAGSVAWEGWGRGGESGLSDRRGENDQLKNAPPPHTHTYRPASSTAKKCSRAAARSTPTRCS